MDNLERYLEFLAEFSKKSKKDQLLLIDDIGELWDSLSCDEQNLAEKIYLQKQMYKGLYLSPEEEREGWVITEMQPGCFCKVLRSDKVHKGLVGNLNLDKRNNANK